MPPAHPTAASIWDAPLVAPLVPGKVPRRVPASEAVRFLPPPWNVLGRTPAVLGWEQADGEAILVDADRNEWNAGHVNAIAPSDRTNLLVGAHTGGVWLLAPEPSKTTFVRAQPLSNDWDNPNILSLAAGPDGPKHAYAGCYTIAASSTVLYERLASGAWVSLSTPVGFGDVYAIGIAVSRRRIVCATSGGVWWSPLPPPRGRGRARAYTWLRATWPASEVGCSGLAMSGDVPVVSSLAGGTIWYGEWSTTGAPTLAMNQGHAGVPDSARSSIAACQSGPEHLYCVVSHNGKSKRRSDGTPDPNYDANLDGTIAALLVSSTGGRTWTELPDTKVTNEPGPPPLVNHQITGSRGDYWNNCIAVSPKKPSVVSVGWQSGVFLSKDSGAAWTRINADSPHLHRDVHTVFFDPRDGKGLTFYVGSDGGAAGTRDLGGTFSSAYNRFLLNLQFQSLPERMFYGHLDASPFTPGLVAGGLQDNGVAWTEGKPWRRTTPGDGSTCAFLANNENEGLVYCTSLDNDRARQSLWQHFDLSRGATVPLTKEDGTTEPGLINPVAEQVVAPAYARNARKMYAVGGYGQEPNVVYGLFADDDAGNPSWEHVVTLPDTASIWAFASADGSLVHVGAASPPAVYAVDPEQRTARPLGDVSQLSIVGSNPSVTRIVLLSDGTVVAACNTDKSGVVAAYDAANDRWEPLTGGASGLSDQSVYGLEADPWNVLYAATDDHVHVSYNRGQQWHDMSAGLPRRAHLGYLRFIHYPSGGIALYLSTFGRSLWRARWLPAEQAPRPGTGGGLGLAWNQLVGSLADGRLGQWTGHGFKPVGPIDPELSREAAAHFAGVLAGAARLAGAVATAREALSSHAAGSEAFVAVARCEALSNQLARGLAVLTQIGSTPTKDLDGDLLETARHATALVTESARGLTAALSPREGALGLRATQPALHKALFEPSRAIAAHTDQLHALEQSHRRRHDLEDAGPGRAGLRRCQEPRG
jgi:hypothetical protein